jgi:hypothetical protein
MQITQLYDEIYRAITNDDGIMELMGLLGESALNKAKRVQKRRQPMNLADSDTILTFYTLGGRRQGSNDYVFNIPYIFDVYTKDDIELAQDISGKLLLLFDSKISNFKGLSTFETKFENQFESIVDLDNRYCFTTILVFSLSLVP